ncbi:hypothetical protein ABK040_002732 [Willaertia magna]
MLLKLSDDLILTISHFLTDPHPFELTCLRIRNVIVTSLWKEKFQQQIYKLESTTTFIANDNFLCFISPNEYLQKLLLKQQQEKKDLTLLQSCYKIAFYYTKWLRDFKLEYTKKLTFLYLNENPLNDLIIKSYKYSNYNKYSNLFLQENYPQKLLVNGLNCKLHFDDNKNSMKELKIAEEDRKRRINQQQQQQGMFFSLNDMVKGVCIWACVCICPCFWS